MMEKIPGGLNMRRRSDLVHQLQGSLRQIVPVDQEPQWREFAAVRGNGREMRQCAGKGPLRGGLGHPIVIRCSQGKKER